MRYANWTNSTFRMLATSFNEWFMKMGFVFCHSSQWLFLFIKFTSLRFFFCFLRKNGKEQFSCHVKFSNPFNCFNSVHTIISLRWKMKEKKTNNHVNQSFDNFFFPYFMFTAMFVSIKVARILFFLEIRMEEPGLGYPSEYFSGSGLMLNEFEVVVPVNSLKLKSVKTDLRFQFGHPTGTSTRNIHSGLTSRSS